MTGSELANLLANFSFDGVPWFVVGHQLDPASGVLVVYFLSRPEAHDIHRVADALRPYTRGVVGLSFRHRPDLQSEK